MALTYDIILKYLTIGAAALAVLVTLTNIFSQVIKRIVGKDNYPVQLIVLLVAEFLTEFAMVCACLISRIEIYWYYYVLAFIVGVVVTFGAMFGYDNLYKELFNSIKEVINSIFHK